MTGSYGMIRLVVQTFQIGGHHTGERRGTGGAESSEIDEDVE